MSSSNNSDDLNDGVGGGEERALPPEVWASVMQYLPFETILSCAATSRMILRNAIPLLKTLHINKPSQINLALAYRFRDVTEININCILKVEIVQQPGEPDCHDVDVDNESRWRVVPFISKFYKLERVIFRRRGEDGEAVKRFAIAEGHFWEEGEGYPDEAAKDKMLAFLDSISGAFRCGAFPKKLKVMGLCCPKVKDAAQTMEQPSSCETCLRACKSFPLESVLHFECRQSSTIHAYSGRLHELDVCLNKSEIESVIESRPGGHELLRSDERLLRLLGSGRHYELPADDGDTLHLVSYSDDQLVEIQRVIKYAELNVKDIPSPNVNAAILRSFRTDNCTSLPTSTRRYLSPLSIEHLTSKIGLPIDAKDFEVLPSNIIEHFLPKIGLILADEESDEFDGIEAHCLRLISDFLEVTDTLCQQIDELIPGLVQRLRGNLLWYEYAVSSIMNIIIKGTPKQRNRIVGAGGIPPLIQCLESSKDSVVIAAVRSLAKLATGRSKKHREKVVTNETIPRFIELLDSKHDKCVESSLCLLVTATKSHVIGLSDIGLIPPLTRIMKSPSRLHMLPECSTLLLNIINFGQPFIQDVIDGAILPTVIDIMNTNDDSTVHTILAHVLIKLATSDQTDVIAKVDGLLSVLVTLLDSSNDAIANESIVALGNIVQMAPEYRNLVVEAGVMKPLLHILNHSDKVGIVLKNATETFSQCCQGKSSDFSATKAALNVLTGLIVDDDIDVLRHACWALFHLLDGLDYKDVQSVMRNLSFIKNILNHAIHLLQLSTFPLELPVLKTLYLITKADKAGGIDAIIRCEGIAAISKSLSTNHEEHRILACKAMCNIISGSRDRLQAAIDCEMFPQLFEILSRTQDKYALQVILEATDAANLVQSRYLVNSDCVKHLCTFLTTDIEALPCRIGQMRLCNTEIVALCSLRNLLATAKSEVNSEDHSGAEHPLQSRGEGHQNLTVHQNYDPNADDESDSDEYSSSVEDEDLIHEMIVQNSGTSEINGIYIRAGSYDGVSKYTKWCFYEGRDEEFSLYRCKLTDSTRRWYISIVPMNSHPGTTKDIDFYATAASYNDDGTLPPRHNWICIPSRGISPSPEVYPKTNEDDESHGPGSVEKMLRNFLDESNQREQTLDVIKLLQQKKAWLKVDTCEQRVESLNNAVAILTDLLKQADQQLHSLQEKRVKAEKHSPLDKVCDKLVGKQIESIAFMSNQLKEVNKEVLGAKLSLEWLSTKAKEIAPKAEWYARLGKDDLPADLDDVIKALRISTSNLKSFDATRSSKKWHDRVHKLREGVEMVFQLLDVDSKKSQCDDDLSHVSVHHLEEAPQKKRRLDSTIEKVNAGTRNMTLCQYKKDVV